MIMESSRLKIMQMPRSSSFILKTRLSFPVLLGYYENPGMKVDCTLGGFDCSFLQQSADFFCLL